MGKGILRMKFLNPHEWALGLEHFLPRDKKSPHPLLNLSPCVGISLFQTQCVILCPAWATYGAWPTPVLYLSPVGRGWVPEGCRRAKCQASVGGGVCWPRETNTHYWSWSSLSLLLVSTGVFHPVLDCTVFSLVTPIAGHSGQKCSDFYSC